jgi:hypothetical protein
MESKTQQEMPLLSNSYRYVLARWEWVDNGIEEYWQPPAGTLASLDLRPNPAQVLKGKQAAEGFGLFALDQSAPIPAGALNLGTNLNTVPDVKTTRDVEERLELAVGDLSTATLLNGIWAIFTNLADVTGANHVKPSMPNIVGNIELRLTGRSLVKSERFDKVKHPFVRSMVMQDFARYKRQTVSGRTARDEGRVLQTLKTKYGFKASEIAVPSGGASVSDNFIGRTVIRWGPIGMRWMATGTFSTMSSGLTPAGAIQARCVTQQNLILMISMLSSNLRVLTCQPLSLDQP